MGFLQEHQTASTEPVSEGFCFQQYSYHHTIHASKFEKAPPADYSTDDPEMYSYPQMFWVFSLPFELGC
jgi:hypothetical protein